MSQCKKDFEKVKKTLSDEKKRLEKEKVAYSEACKRNKAAQGAKETEELGSMLAILNRKVIELKGAKTDYKRRKALFDRVSHTYKQEIRASYRAQASGTSDTHSLLKRDD